MPLVGIQYGEQSLAFKDAHIESRAGRLPFPEPLLAAMESSRSDDTPSASVLSGCMRQFRLKRSVPYYEKVTNNLSAIFGTAFHLLMEQHRKERLRPGEHSERKLGGVLNVDGVDVTLSGTVDFLREGELISDWKSKRFIPVGWKPPKKHKAQVNVYNWLAAQNGYGTVPHWELVYVSQTWLARFTGDMRPLADTEGWMRKQLRPWLESERTGALPPPVPELFQPSDKDGSLPEPCGFCPVREACLAELKREATPPFPASLKEAP